MRWRRGRTTSHRIGAPAEATAEFAHAIALVTELAVLYQLIAQRFLEMSRHEQVILVIADESANRLHATEGSTLGQLTIDFDSKGPLARWLRANGECLVLESSKEVVGYLSARERETLESISARVCVPLVAFSDLSGILIFISRTKRPLPSNDELELWKFCGRQAAFACERLRAQKADRDRLEKMMRADQLAVAGQLAAGVAHEVRNPLTAIRSALQQLLVRVDDVERRQMLLTVALEEVDRISATITGILTLSKPQSVNFEPVDLTDVADEAVRLVRPYIDERALMLNVHFNRRPLAIVADKHELRRVFVNLLLNACQATASPGEIRLSSEIVMADGDVPTRTLACIHVTDTGSGMTQEQRDRAFDLFYTTKGNGTGLGLPICLGIVQRHAGLLRLDTVLGVGTTASVMIPLVETQA